MKTSTFQIQLNTDAFERSASGSIVGPVWVTLGDAQYPELGWSDFPVVVLGWWLDELASLSHRSESAVFRFMDGPFQFTAQRDGETAQLLRITAETSGSAEAVVVGVPLGTLNVAIEAAGRVVAAECRRRGWSSRDVEGLASRLGPLH